MKPLNNANLEDIKRVVKLDKNTAQPKYLADIPACLQHLINGIYDPIGDGNCGFHCMAQALGYGKDGWMRVRK
ncbi:hypothetical protein PCANC_14861 [Puccinia coronata f. sp. avenae]|uniref:OTU domain-containing protein n=1 Tax=Puccinia coronata f. sp. avenae TaxID=200324 RepID=A0A2N5S3V2_9BASI|nr:hypothetical protein PCANC_25155 [Puccinia coronata f. sp. avenae]PLW39408.1 hypothetical protein PCANC_14861 [Puccinia coronata f. sp. avenae]